MASLDAILCSEPHSAPFAYEPARQDVPVPERDAAPDKILLGKPPFALSGSRRKSGWGKRFKEREQGRLAIIFPRRKMGEASRGSDAVWLSVEVLNSLADRSLASAAKLLVRNTLSTCGVESRLCRPVKGCYLRQFICASFPCGCVVFVLQLTACCAVAGHLFDSAQEGLP